MDAADATFLSIPDLLKATPREEGGHRFLYLEASNEHVDQQAEVVLAKALSNSADYYLKFGNLDLDHYSQLGPRMGIPDYSLYEIGRPVDVQASGGHTFVKAELYRGEGPVAKRANEVWDGLTNTTPPTRWYPSVGGAVLERGTDTDPLTKATHAVIRKVRWTNIGLSRTPVNQHVPTAATVPFGVFAKCWSAAGLDLTKAMDATGASASAAGLSAGYGTDSATLSGGAALRKQSADPRPASYWDYRDRMASDVSAGRAGASAEGIAAHGHAHFGLGKAESAEWAERFMRDLADGRSKRVH